MLYFLTDAIIYHTSKSETRPEYGKKKPYIHYLYKKTASFFNDSGSVISILRSNVLVAINDSFFPIGLQIASVFIIYPK